MTSPPASQLSQELPATLGSSDSMDLESSDGSDPQIIESSSSGPECSLPLPLKKRYTRQRKTGHKVRVVADHLISWLWSLTDTSCGQCRSERPDLLPHEELASEISACQHHSVLPCVHVVNAFIPIEIVRIHVESVGHDCLDCFHACVAIALSCNRRIVVSPSCKEKGQLFALVGCQTRAMARKQQEQPDVPDVHANIQLCTYMTP